jgi:hypothetical protein
MRKSCFLGSLALISSLVGCATDTSAPPEATTSDPLVTTTWSDNVEVQPDRLVFSSDLRRSESFTELLGKITAYETAYADALGSSPSNLSADQQDVWATDHLREKGVEPVFMIGKRQANAVNADGTIRADVKNPNGYLRRATALSTGPNGGVVVRTSQATFAEANHELERMGMLNVKRSRAADGSNDHWEWGTQYPFTISHVDLSRVLYQKTFGAGLGTVRVGFKDSFIDVSGNLDAYVAGRWVSPRVARGILTTNLTGQLVLDGNFDSAFGTSSGDIDLYEKSYDITAIGGFPLTLDFEVTGKCDLAANGRVNASAGVRLDGSLKAGGTYLRDEGFGAVWEPTWPQFTRVGPTLTSQARIEGTCAITATARAHLFDALGPEASATAYLRLEANGSTSGTSAQARAKVFGGVDSRIGGTLRPFGVELASLSATPFQKEWLLFDQPVSIH